MYFFRCFQFTSHKVDQQGLHMGSTKPYRPQYMNQQNQSVLAEVTAHEKWTEEEGRGARGGQKRPVSGSTSNSDTSDEPRETKILYNEGR